MSGRLSNGQRVGLGSGDFALNLYWQTTSLFLLFYYTDVLGLPTAVAGLIYMVALVWDAVLDPVAGLLVERTRSTYGRYRGYLLFGAVPLALSFIVLFVGPSYPASGSIAIAAITHVLFRTVYTFIAVPYTSLYARVTKDSDERALLTGFRIFFAAGALILVATTGIPLATQLGGLGGPKLGWIFIAIGYSLVATALLWAAAASARKLDLAEDTGDAPANVSQTLRAIRSNWPLFVVLGAIIVTSFCFTMFSKNLLYYFKYVRGSASEGSFGLAFLAVVTAVSVPLWTYLARKIGKKSTWLLGIAPLCLGLVGWFITDPTATLPLYIALALIAAGNGAAVVCFWAMVPDTVEFAQWRSGIRSESFVFGLVTFAQKAALGIAAGALGLVLQRIGYVANVEQSAETLADLKLLMVGTPLAGAVVTAILLSFYPISSSFHQEMLREIDQRDAAPASEN